MGRLIVLILLGGLLAGSLPAAVQAAGPEQMVVEQKCTMCHDFSLLEEKQAYFSEWEVIVERMAAYDGNLITPTDKLMALKYIKQHFALDGPGGRARHEKK